MGSGWLIPELEISFVCASKLWPSSTKAELIAIWTAILTVPNNINIVDFYTDSQASIDGIKKFSSHNIRTISKSPNSYIIEQINRVANLKSQTINYIKVKGHSGLEYNDVADDLAKQATTYAILDESLITIPNFVTMHSTVQFQLLWNKQHWDGQLRINLTTFATLPQCADWAISSAISQWIDNDLRNTVPIAISSLVNDIVNVNRLYSSPVYIRWDHTWNLFRSLHHLNRHGPSFSNFNSFAIKILNNLLPTGDNLAKRHDQIYDNWMCLFCNSELETLDHLFTCPSLSQQWVEISKLSLQFLRSITSNLRIKAALPSDFLNYLPRITTQPSSVVWSPIQYLAKGIFPAFVLDDLRTMKINSHINTICSGLLKNAINAFHEHIWKPRCILNVNKEKRLGITKSAKRFRTPSHSRIQQSWATPNILGQYQLLLEC